MTSRKAAVVLLAALVGALAVLGGAGARRSAAPGVTTKAVLLGSTGPLTGGESAAADVLRGAEAYFKFVNSRGGVSGRKIDFRYYDDAGDPETAAENARRLVEQDQVLALFSTVGTDANLAIRAFASESRVPHLFVASAATTFGRDSGRYPYSIAYPPSDSAEGRLYARFLLSTGGKASKIAVLYEDDEDGNDLLDGLVKGLGKQRAKIVATSFAEPGATDLGPEIADLKASGANTLMVFASGRLATQAYRAAFKLGWKPVVYVGARASAAAVMRLAPGTTAEGSISATFVRDPALLGFATDPGALLAGTIVKRFAPGTSPRDRAVVAGMAAAFTMVDTLRRAGKNLTRESLLRAATSLNEANNPFLVPGIVVRTTPTSRLPVTQLRLMRWTRGRWQLLGGLVTVRP